MHSLLEVVVCRFEGCNDVFKDARILPCGNTTCFQHIAAMLKSTSENDNGGSRSLLVECRFCGRTHALDEAGPGGLPVDTKVAFLLSMRHTDEHEAAKRSLAELIETLNDTRTRMCNRTASVSPSVTVGIGNISLSGDSDDYERHVHDIEMEREIELKRVNVQFDERRLRLAEQWWALRECLNDKIEKLRTELDLVAAQISDHRLEFDVRTWNGDDAKWTHIRQTCQALNAKVLALCNEWKALINESNNTSDNSISHTPLESLVPTSSHGSVPIQVKNQPTDDATCTTRSMFENVKRDSAVIHFDTANMDFK